MALTQCPECGKEVSTSAELCPHCGYRLIAKPQNPIKAIPKSVIITLVSIFVVVFLVRGCNNMLWGNDRIAYNIAVKCAEKSFFYPETVQLQGGHFSVDKTCMWCRVRAKSSGGAMVTNDWFFDGESGEVAELDKYSSWCTATEDFNIDKVNNALRKHFGK